MSKKSRGDKKGLIDRIIHPTHTELGSIQPRTGPNAVSATDDQDEGEDTQNRDPGDMVDHVWEALPPKDDGSAKKAPAGEHRHSGSTDHRKFHKFAKQK